MKSLMNEPIVSNLDFRLFSVAWLRGKYRGLRYGQAFCNHVIPQIDDPELFYEEDDNKAAELIGNRYLTGVANETNEANSG